MRNYTGGPCEENRGRERDNHTRHLVSVSKVREETDQFRPGRGPVSWMQAPLQNPKYADDRTG
jgi:hypothetical protein